MNVTKRPFCFEFREPIRTIGTHTFSEFGNASAFELIDENVGWGKKKNIYIYSRAHLSRILLTAPSISTDGHLIWVIRPLAA
jgi:hypothetical protein